MSAPAPLWMAAVIRACRSFWLMRSSATSTPACLPNSFACSSNTWSAAGTKCDHWRTCSLVPWAKAGARPAAVATAADALRNARRVRGMTVSWSGTEHHAPPVLDDDDCVRLDLLDTDPIEQRVPLDVLAAIDEGEPPGALLGVHDDLEPQRFAGLAARRGRGGRRWCRHARGRRPQRRDDRRRWRCRFRPRHCRLGRRTKD